ncbi:MAG: hypothetical protein KDI55_00160 [Anaerolineae bacterium]|nr:hypothetical protein [Anaerolineae bacterium]
MKRVYEYLPDGAGGNAPPRLFPDPFDNNKLPPAVAERAIDALMRELTARDERLDDEDMARAEEDIGWSNYARRCQMAVETLRPFLSKPTWDLLYEHVMNTTSRRRPHLGGE